MGVPDSGIEFSSLLEEALAAQWWGHKSITSFKALDPFEQAYLIAVYVAYNDIRAVQQNEAVKEAEMKQKRNSK